MPGVRASAGCAVIVCLLSTCLQCLLSECLQSVLSVGLQSVCCLSVCRVSAVRVSAGESTIYTIGTIGRFYVMCTKLPRIGAGRAAQISAGSNVTRLLGQ